MDPRSGNMPYLILPDLTGAPQQPRGRREVGSGDLARSPWAAVGVPFGLWRQPWDARACEARCRWTRELIVAIREFSHAGVLQVLVPSVTGKV